MIRPHYIVLAGAAFWVAFFVSTAQARQLVCGDYTAAIAILKKAHHEKLKHRAVTRSGHLFELWVSRQGTWTALIVPRPGIACGLADGDGFVPVSEPSTRSRDPRS